MIIRWGVETSHSQAHQGPANGGIPQRINNTAKSTWDDQEHTAKSTWDDQELADDFIPIPLFASCH